MSSLRSRLILGTLVGITLCLALSGILIYASVRERRYDDLDRSLQTLLRSMVPSILHELGKRSRDGSFAARADDSFPGMPRRPDLFFQCWTEDGETLVRSPSLGDGTLAPLAGDPSTVAFATVSLPGGTPGRAAGMRMRFDRTRAFSWGPRRRPPGFDDEGEGSRPEREIAPSPPEGGPAHRRSAAVVDAVVAQDTGEIARDLEQLRWLLVLGWLSSSLGCAGILGWVVHRSLRPVDELRRQLERLDEAQLDLRFKVDDAPAELRPVVDQLNAMLERLAQAFEREQTLTAHAAHELRTPLTGLRSTLEVCLSRPRHSEEYRAAARECLGITLLMQSMVERLLELNRRRSIAAVEEASLGELVDRAWRPYAELARDRSLGLDRAFEPSLIVTTDIAGLERVLANLLENAATYADPGGAIELSAERAGGDLVLVVANRASGAPADVAQHAFEAFWRADASRTEVGRHAGLGLTLCKRIVEGLGGRIEAALVDERFVVTVRLPGAVPRPSDARP